MAGGPKHILPRLAGPSVRREHHHDPTWDTSETETSYVSLERVIIPEFYARDDRGIPRGWVGRRREIVARLTSVFSTNRGVPCMNVASVVTVTAMVHERSQAARRLWTVRNRARD